MRIVSVNNKIIKDLIKLKQKKYRDLEKRFIVEGYHLVLEAYNANLLDTVIAVNEDDFKSGVKGILVSEEVIKKFSSTITPQPIVGIVKYFDFKEKDASRILILDNIQDPGNMGTLIRTSLAFGIEKIIISLDTIDFYNDKVIRASQGSIFKIPIFKKSLVEEINILKKKGIKIIASSLDDNSLDVTCFKAVEKFALILGNEGSGIRQEVLKASDVSLKIPIKGIDSLNVAIAGAILLYSLTVK